MSSVAQVESSFLRQVALPALLAAQNSDGGWGFSTESKSAVEAHELGSAGNFRDGCQSLARPTGMPGGPLSQKSATSRRVMAGRSRTEGRGMGDLACVHGAARIRGRVAGDRPGARVALPRMARRRRLVVAHPAAFIRRHAPGTTKRPAARMELDAGDKQLGGTDLACLAGASRGAPIACYFAAGKAAS